MSICFTLLLLFLLHSVFFLIVIYFDYDYLSRSVFSVYPMIAYAAMALWLGLGVYETAKYIVTRVSAQKYLNHLVICSGVSISTIIYIKIHIQNNRHDYVQASRAC